MPRTGDQNLLPSVKRWLAQAGIPGETVQLIYRDTNFRLALCYTDSGHYLTFLRRRNRPVIGFFLPELLPLRPRRRVEVLINLHQQQLKDQRSTASHGQAHHV